MNPAKQTNLYPEIKNILAQARQTSYRAVNVTMVMAYWQVGKLIVEDEQKGKKRAGYGDALLKELSAKLTADFGKGFDERNLRYFRLFYLRFPIWNAVRSKSGTAQSKSIKRNAVRSRLAEEDILRPELTWTHYRILLSVEDAAACAWYIQEAADNNWSTRTLERQINSLTYQRILSSKNKKAVRQEILQKTEKASPLDFIKDPYVLEFLKLPRIKTFMKKILKKP